MRMLISELLDFRKLEQGHVKLKVYEQNIIPFLKDLSLFLRICIQPFGDLSVHLRGGRYRMLVRPETDAEGILQPAVERIQIFKTGCSHRNGRRRE